MLIREAWDQFITYLTLLNNSPHTIKQYSIDGKQFIYFLKKKNVSSMEEDIAILCHQYIKELTSKGYKNKTINRKISSLRSFVGYASTRGWIKNDFSETLLTLPKDNQKIVPLSKIEIRHVLTIFLERARNAKNEELKWMYYRNHVIMHVLVNLGLTPEELVDMSWSHLTQRETLIIASDLMNHREIPLRKTDIEVFRNYRRLTLKYLKKPTMPVDSYMWFGIKRNPNMPLNVKAIERIVNLACEDFSIRRTALHFRHTLLLKKSKKFTMEELQEYFGYKDYETVRKHLYR